jgi:hypothetical protein
MAVLIILLSILSIAAMLVLLGPWRWIDKQCDNWEDSDD